MSGLNKLKNLGEQIGVKVYYYGNENDDLSEYLDLFEFISDEYKKTKSLVEQSEPSNFVEMFQKKARKLSTFDVTDIDTEQVKQDFTNFFTESKNKLKPLENTNTNLISEEKNLVIQLIDIHDDYEGMKHKLVIIGRDVESGKSVCVTVYNFKHYFYTNKTTDFFKDVKRVARGVVYGYGMRAGEGKKCGRYECECGMSSSYSSTLDCCVKNKALVTIDDGTFSCEAVEMKTIMGYQKDKQKYIRMSCQHPFLVNDLVKSIMWKKKAGKDAALNKLEILEGDVSPVDRFMVDRDIVGCGFISISNFKNVQEKQSHCDVEISCDIDSVERTEHDGIVPLRVLGFDIECMSIDVNKFPTPDQCPVIQIGCSLQKGTDVVDNVVFCLEDTDDIPNGRIESFKCERKLISRFVEYIVENDVDIITGFNSDGFDIPYLYDRAETLELGTFPFLSRIRNIRTNYKKRKSHSNQTGARETYSFFMPGRINMDVMLLIRNQYNLSSYALNAVSEYFLKDKKEEDISYRDIPVYQKESPSKRAIIAKYCMQDTHLVIKLLNKLNFVVNNVAFSQTLGVRLMDVFTRGQTYRLMRKIREYAKREKLLIPTYGKGDNGKTYVPLYDTIDTGETTEEKLEFVQFVFNTDDEQNKSKSKGVEIMPGQRPINDSYEGAIVLDPMTKYYEEEIVSVFDFKSLYPSLMRDFNLSWDSFIPNLEYAKAMGVEMEQINVSPLGYMFVKEEVHCGLVNMIETELNGERNRVKKLMKNEEDGFQKSVYDARQLAVKVIMNSLYGVLGALTSKLPGKHIAASITAYGRKSIIDTKKWMEDNYNAVVVYGDTDSVFVKLPRQDGTGYINDIVAMNALCKKIEDCVNDVEKGGLYCKEDAMTLEYEKSFVRLALFGKKRYVGLKYEGANKPKLSYMGIELKRRDSALLSRDLQQHFFDLCVVQGKKDEALSYLREYIQKLLMNELDFTMYVMSAKLSRFDYKNAVPALEVNKKIAKRDPSLVYTLGERVQYVITKNGEKKVANKADDPDYVRENNISIDIDHYFETQIRKPFERILPLIFDDETARRVLDTRSYKRMITTDKNSIANFFGNKSHKRVVHPTSASITSKKLKQADIGGFFKVK